MSPFDSPSLARLEGVSAISWLFSTSLSSSIGLPPRSGYLNCHTGNDPPPSGSSLRC